MAGNGGGSGRTKAWFWILGAVIVALAVALVVVLVTRDDDDDTPTTTTSTSTTAAPTTTSTTVHTASTTAPPPPSTTVALPVDHRRPADLRGVPVRDVAERQPHRCRQRGERRRGHADVLAGVPGQGPVHVLQLRPGGGIALLHVERPERRDHPDDGAHPHRRSADPGSVGDVRTLSAN